MRDFGQHPVFVFGAGATKACGGPLTAEILPDAFQPSFFDQMARKDLAELVEACLVQHFHVPAKRELRRPEDYPPLPLVLSLLDLAIDQDRPLVFGSDSPRRDYWDRKRLAEARAAIDYVVFAILDEHLRTVQQNVYQDLFHRAWQDEPYVISLNYDILLDNVLFQVAEERAKGRPAYVCDIQTDAYRSRKREYGEILKLHGSLNWLYCASCRRLDIGMSDCGRTAVMCKVLEELYQQTSLDSHYKQEAAACPDCGTPLRAVMITPTRTKDYRNPHIQSIWYQAERRLRTADRLIFVGYSLPDDDLEVIDLLRRGAGHLNGEAVTVVEFDPEQRPLDKHPVGRRYRSIFGTEIRWITSGFGPWVQDARGASMSA